MRFFVSRCDIFGEKKVRCDCHPCFLLSEFGTIISSRRLWFCLYVCEKYFGFWWPKSQTMLQKAFYCRRFVPLMVSFSTINTLQPRGDKRAMFPNFSFYKSAWLRYSTSCLCKTISKKHPHIFSGYTLGCNISKRNIKPYSSLYVKTELQTT